MSQLTEKPIWESGIYKITTETPVLGFNEVNGDAGPSNIQAQQLAHRTAFLKQIVDGISTGDVPYTSVEAAQAAINAGKIPLDVRVSVRGSDENIWVAEYQNVNGVATPTGRTQSTSAALDVIINRFNGINNVFAHPNKWYDDTFNLLVSGDSAGKLTDANGGRYFKSTNAQAFVIPYVSGDAAHLTSTDDELAYLQYEISLEGLGAIAGQSLTFMYRLVSKLGTTNGNDRVLLMQFNGDSEITSARITHPLPTHNLLKAEERSATVTLAPACTKVRFYISISSQGSSVDFDNMLIAPGIVNQYRPSLEKLKEMTLNSIVELSIRKSVEALGLTQTQPNIFHENAVNIISIPYLTSGIAALSPSTFKGTPAWRLTIPATTGIGTEAGVRIGSFKRSVFDGTMISASLNLLALESNPYTSAAVRILLRQFDAAGTEIVAARTVIAAYDGAGFMFLSIPIEF